MSFGDPRPIISWRRQGGQLPVGRSHQINGTLVLREIEMWDRGIYICAATSAGVLNVQTVTTIEVLNPRGEFWFFGSSDILYLALDNTALNST